MKIISKYKDYYDYLVGIYGEDPNIILDRRKFDIIDIQSLEHDVIEIYIGGYVINGYVHNGKVHYGEDLKQFEYVRSCKRKRYLSSLFKKKDNIVEIERKHSNKLIEVCTTIEIDKNKYNEKYNCPILVNNARIFGNDKDFLMYCKLDELNLNSFITAPTVYKYISDFLSKQKTEQENYKDNRNDIQKIESAGFDKKTSFRGK